MALEKIPRILRDLALVAEDAKFYRHPGFDFEQIEYALVSNHQAGKPARGASTISQQVAKNLFLSGDKAMSRKLHEAAITLVMEEVLGKDRILELYLNIAQLGPGVFGVKAGSKHHFGKQPSELTEQEALSLMTLLPSPEKWSPDSRRGVYQSHKRRVAKNYALFRGRGLAADTLDGEAELRALDGIDSIMTEERWKPLLREAPPLPGDSTNQGALDNGGYESLPSM
jgi:monofunctional biosynthetic peptidoglycan transglycosylase